MTSAAVESKTLLEFIIDLLTDPEARERFEEDPMGELRAAGLEDISVEELQALVPFLLERLDPQRAAHYDDHCDDDRDARDACDDNGTYQVFVSTDRYDTHDSGDCGPWKPSYDCDDRPTYYQHHDVEIAKVVTHLNFVVNNYSFDSHDTIFNTTNTTVVWANNSDVDVRNDTVNQVAGDESVIVGRDANAPVVTGDDAVVGDGNLSAGGPLVVGDGNQVADGDAAFGAGSLVKGNDLDGGSALNVGAGSAATDIEDNDLTAFGSNVATSGGTVNVGSGNTTVTDSGNTTVSDSGNGNDSGNTTTTDSVVIQESLNDNSSTSLVGDVAAPQEPETPAEIDLAS